MVEVELNRPTLAAQLLHRAGILALAVRRGELHHIADLVGFIGVAQLVEQLARHPLNQLGVAVTKGNAGWQLEGGAFPFGHAQNALLDGRR